MTSDQQFRSEPVQRAWDEHERSQLEYFRSLSLREKLEAVQGMADVVRRFQQVRAQGGFRTASPEPEAARTETPPVAREPASHYGSGEGRHEVVLQGCTPEPLMNYLKALGILRLVAEQADPHARGAWRDNMFHLISALDGGALVDFLLQRYRPTPIVVPWSGNDFFDVNPEIAERRFEKTPSGAKAIEAFLACGHERLSEYRGAIAVALRTLETLRVRKKEQLGKPEVKAAYLAALRSTADTRLVDWIDAAAVIGKEKATFSGLLGSGGGSDGNTHFSDNFMQNLWEVLPEFDSGRSRSRKGQAEDASETAQHQRSLALLRSALFGDLVGDLAEKRTSSLFDSGAVGGPNATQGTERESLTNPWNFILGLEGTLLFAGAVARRIGSASSGTSFPFQFQFSSTEADRAVSKEQAGREIWLPLWGKRTRLSEIRLLLGEGRAEVGHRAAIRGVDMARAATGLGVDRGVQGFQRFGIVKGRVGGENYNTAVSLGRFDVRLRKDGDLLRQLDPWLDGFRRACKIGQKDEAPSRITACLRRIDGTILDYCRYGGTGHFQAILVALGRAERELMRDGSWASKKRVRPLAGLSPDWMAAANDSTTAFEVALALAGVHDAEFNVGPLRANLEPVVLARRGEGGVLATWAEKERAVVWNAADPIQNLAAVLARRIMDGSRKGCERLPLAFRHTASLEAIAAFIAGDVDDSRVGDLLWGLMLVDPGKPSTSRRPPEQIEAPPLPRTYALLKLLFLPWPLIADRDREGRLRWRYAGHGERGIEVRPEPGILPLLLAGRLPEACEIATRRLLVSGLMPMSDRTALGRHGSEVWERPGGAPSGERLAASLLLPIASRSVDRLIKLVTRQDGNMDSETFDSEEETA